MKNPWEEISLADYEGHMGQSSVMQLQALSQIMKEQFSSCPAKTVMVLGVAGGNGLEHIAAFDKVIGVDINPDYLQICGERFSRLGNQLELVCADLTQPACTLPHADLVVANLFIEYIGYAHFQRAIQQIGPQRVSCVIQKNTDHSFVSPSPYAAAFRQLGQVHCQIQEQELIDTMKAAFYQTVFKKERALPNGKALLRLDFQRQ